LRSWQAFVFLDHRIRRHSTTCTGGPKTQATTKLSKNRIKLYASMPMRSDLFFKLKYQSRTIMISVGNKYSVRELLCDVINNSWSAK